MAKKVNEETIKKINKEIEGKIEKIKELRELCYEETEDEKLYELNKKMVEIYEEIFKEILDISKQNKIKELEEIDKRIPAFKFGLEHFVDSYLSVSNWSNDKKAIEKETKILKELIDLFDFEEESKKEYELIIIRDLYVVGKKEKAEEILEKWIKEHPEEGEGYQIKCEWELDKNEPDMEKIAKILEEADNNGTFIFDEYIYDNVIEYYEDLGNDKKAEYFESLLEKMEDEEDDFYDEIDKNLDLEDIFEDEKKELIEEFEKSGNDKISKSKKFKDYVEEKEGIELIAFLGIQSVTKSDEELGSILEEPKKYITENYEEILKENIKYMPQYVIELIKETDSSGLIEKDLNEMKLEELEKMYEYFSLKPYGMDFISCKNKKLTIVIPFIKKMKEYVEDTELMEENKKINEKINVIVGMSEVHGALKEENIYSILEEIYQGIGKKEVEQLVLIACGFLGLTGLKINPEKRKIEYIYQILINEETAEEILEANKEIKNHTKDEYLKYSDKKFLYKMEGYKTIEKEVNSGMFFGEKLFRVLGEILIPYTIERRLGSKLADELLEKLLQQLTMMEQIGMGTINKQKIQKGFKELDDELPRWK